VANQASSTIAVFNLKDSGNVAPKRMIAGTPTALNAPVGLALSW